MTWCTFLLILPVRQLFLPDLPHKHNSRRMLWNRHRQVLETSTSIVLLPETPFSTNPLSRSPLPHRADIITQSSSVESKLSASYTNKQEASDHAWARRLRRRTWIWRARIRRPRLRGQRLFWLAAIWPWTRTSR